MLKVTELMINDWVRINGSDFRVMEIKKKGVIKLYDIVLGREHQIDFNTDYLEEFLEPIPLTGEILEKIGFKERNPLFGNKEYISDFHVMLCSWNNGESFNYHFYEPVNGRDCWFPHEVRYVHELQHYFKDCKLEKEIVL